MYRPATTQVGSSRSGVLDLHPLFTRTRVIRFRSIYRFQQLSVRIGISPASSRVPISLAVVGCRSACLPVIARGRHRCASTVGSAHAKAAIDAIDTSTFASASASASTRPVRNASKETRRAPLVRRALDSRARLDSTLDSRVRLVSSRTQSRGKTKTETKSARKQSESKVQRTGE